MARRNPGARAGKANVPLIVGIVVGVVLLLLVCGGGIYFIFYSGMGMLQQQVRADLEGNPVIAENIGPIATFEVDFGASMKVEGGDVFVFNVSGPKGTGVVVAECLTIDADTEQVVSGTLEMPTGEIYDLFPDGPPPQLNHSPP